MRRVSTDGRFRKRYILRTVLLMVPPLVAVAWMVDDRSQPEWRWVAAAFFVAWIVAWIVADTMLFRAYRCPSCGKGIRNPTIKSRSAGDPIRYYCDTCQIEWDTGLRESRE